MRGTRAAFVEVGINGIGRVDPACGFLAASDLFLAAADIGGILDMERPVLSGPPCDCAAFKIIAGENSRTAGRFGAWS